MLNSDLWLDSSTDIDEPFDIKIEDGFYCQDLNGLDYPALISTQGLEVNGIIPDKYDFFGPPPDPFAESWEFYLRSVDREPHCPESAWLGVDESSCEFVL